MDTFEQGFQAYQDGRDIDENPHSAGSEEYDQWESGWVKASDEDNDAA